MPFERVSPDDPTQVAAVAAILEAAREVDDPTAFPIITESLANEMRYGFDLEPKDTYLYRPGPTADPVGVLQLDLPQRDNLHLVGAGVTTHPDHRRRGHGTAMLDEAVRVAHEVDRSTMWVGLAEDDVEARTFVERRGFRYASHDARRRQSLAEVDQTAVERLHATARAAASDYTVERLVAPTAAEVLAQLVEVSAAINDAPMGGLTHEEQKYDVQRVRDFETAHLLSDELVYRVVARHRGTGEIGGHTVMITTPRRPAVGYQADTAVARSHRGHRLGLLLKIEAMRWLSETEPQLEVVTTWNNVENTFMIEVNESLGYRLDRVFATFERSL